MDACMAGRNCRIQGETDWLTHSSQTLKIILKHCDQVIDPFGDGLVAGPLWPLTKKVLSGLKKSGECEAL